MERSTDIIWLVDDDTCATLEKNSAAHKAGNRMLNSIAEIAACDAIGGMGKEMAVWCGKKNSKSKLTFEQKL